MSENPGITIENRTGHDMGYVAFKTPDGYSVVMMNSDDVVVVHNVEVRTLDEESRLNRTGDDSQAPADGKHGGD